MELIKLQNQWGRICEEERRSKARNTKLLYEIEQLESRSKSLSIKARHLKKVKDDYKAFVKEMWPVLVSAERDPQPRSSTPFNSNNEVRETMNGFSNSTKTVHPNVHHRRTSTPKRNSPVYSSNQRTYLGQKLPSESVNPSKSVDPSRTLNPNREYESFTQNFRAPVSSRIPSDGLSSKNELLPYREEGIERIHGNAHSRGEYGSPSVNQDYSNFNHGRDVGDHTDHSYKQYNGDAERYSRYPLATGEQRGIQYSKRKYSIGTDEKNVKATSSFRNIQENVLDKTYSETPDRRYSETHVAEGIFQLKDRRYSSIPTSSAEFRTLPTINDVAQFTLAEKIPTHDTGSTNLVQTSVKHNQLTSRNAVPGSVEDCTRDIHNDTFRSVVSSRLIEHPVNKLSDASPIVKLTSMESMEATSNEESIQSSEVRSSVVEVQRIAEEVQPIVEVQPMLEEVRQVVEVRAITAEVQPLATDRRDVQLTVADDPVLQENSGTERAEVVHMDQQDEPNDAAEKPSVQLVLQENQPVQEQRTDMANSNSDSEDSFFDSKQAGNVAYQSLLTKSLQQREVVEDEIDSSDEIENEIVAAVTNNVVDKDEKESVEEDVSMGVEKPLPSFLQPTHQNETKINPPSSIATETKEHENKNMTSKKPFQNLSTKAKLAAMGFSFDSESDVDVPEIEHANSDKDDFSFFD